MAIIIAILFVMIFLLIMLALLRRPSSNKTCVMSYPEVLAPQLPIVHPCEEPLLHESGRYKSIRNVTPCTIEIRDEPTGHDTVTHCLGMEEVRPPATISEENCRQYIIQFINGIVNHLYEHHPKHPVTLRLVGSWREHVEIYFQTGVLFYPEHGCFYFNPDIFSMYTFEQLHSAILDELSKPTCACDVDKIEWEKSYKFLLNVATSELNILCAK